MYIHSKKRDRVVIRSEQVGKCVQYINAQLMNNPYLNIHCIVLPLYYHGNRSPTRQNISKLQKVILLSYMNEYIPYSTSHRFSSWYDLAHYSLCIGL